MFLVFFTHGLSYISEGRMQTIRAITVFREIRSLQGITLIIQGNTNATSTHEN